MKVKTLIRLLQKEDPNASVCIMDGSKYLTSSVGISGVNGLNVDVLLIPKRPLMNLSSQQIKHFGLSSSVETGLP